MNSSFYRQEFFTLVINVIIIINVWFDKRLAYGYECILWSQNWKLQHQLQLQTWRLIFLFFLSKTILKHSRFLYKQHFDKQQHDKIGKKIRRKLCNSPRRKFAIWKLFGLFIHVFIWVMRKAFIIEHVQKKRVCFNEIIW